MKIEAGKYYRTRGGERVGPAVRDLAHEYAGKGFVWRVGEYTYTDEGACGLDREPDDDDIVAEWDAAAEKAATPKFQPGDRVRCLETYTGQFTKGKVYTVRDTYDDRILIREDDSGSPSNGWLAEKFERVDAPTPDTPDNPCIKIVTRREVVPGRLPLADGARIEITKVSTGRSGTYVLIGGYAFTATALREAATAFSEIADALDEAGQ